LKPDACRRVVGRLPSPHIRDQLAKADPGFNSAGWRHRSASAFSSCEEKEKFTVVYLVRSFRTYARIRSLTTGTFNRVVKDRIAFRLSGANSVQANSSLQANLHVRIRLSSKPYKHTVRRKTLSTEASHNISTGFPHWEDSGRDADRRAAATKKALSFRIGLKAR
jgi:hypothetical protein